jgi:tetratricopeptide (TPR) repeat protein
MVLFPNRPVLDEKTTEQALDAMRSGHGLHAHPLRLCVTVLSRLESPQALCGNVAVQVAIFDYLKSVISERLTSLRQQYDLPPPDNSCTDAALEADFRRGNMELEAWSLLYYRYICVDRDLSMQRMAAVTHQDERTTRRRHQFGITRLTFELVSREQEARLREVKRRLRLALPVSQPPALFGIESPRSTAMHVLTGVDPPRHLVLHGPAGIGKTVLAQLLAHEMVEADQLEDLLWLDMPAPAPTSTALMCGIVEGLGLPYPDETSPVWTLRAYLLTHPTLIILDHADELMGDEKRITSLLAALDSASIILTSRVRPPSRLWCYPITLPGLNREQAFTFLDHIAGQRERQDDGWAERFEAIWQAVGGNPTMLKAVFDAARTLPVASALARSGIERLYAQIWQQFPNDHQQVCLTALLFSTRGVPYQQVGTLSKLEDGAVDEALLALTDRAFLSAHHDQNTHRYLLSPAVTTFLRVRVQRDLMLADGEPAAAFLRRIMRRRIEQLVHSPDAEAALSLLRLADGLAFPETERWEHAYRLAPQIMEAGLWLAWHQQLKTLWNYEYDLSQTAWLDLTTGITLRWLGQLEEASNYLKRALAYYTTQGSPQQQADVMGELAVIRRYQGEWQEAHRLLQAALDLYTRFDIPQGADRCLHELAQLALEGNDADQALAWLGRLEQWSMRSWGIAGQAHAILQQFDQAREAAGRLQEDALSPVFFSKQGRAAATLGLIYDALGEPDTAVDWLLMATGLLERSKDMVGYARACNNLAVAYLKQPVSSRQLPIRDVRRLLTMALRIQEHIGDEIGLAFTERNLAWLPSVEAGGATESDY